VTKRTKSGEDTLSTYTFHGVDILPGRNGQAVGICPFCGNDKFYVDKKEGLFDCKSLNSCGRSGNKYTFLQMFYETALEMTTVAKYKSLSKARGKVPYQAFQDAELAYDSALKRWIIPIKNEKGSIVNLRVWDPKTKIPMNTSGCLTHLGNMDTIEENETIYICEGEWDAFCLQWLIDKNIKTEKSTGVVFVPGADNFKQEWVIKFHGKHVILVYDNDIAGTKGMSKCSILLQEMGSCKSINSITWPESTPEKYDINDFVSRHYKKPKTALSTLKKYIHEFEPEKKKKEKNSVKCTSFNSLVTRFKKHIHLSSDAKDGLLLMCATILSSKIRGEPVWLFIVGPSGSGKTLLLQTFTQCEQTHMESCLGAKTLISGYKTNDGSDPSLLPNIIGKTLILKDYTEILCMASADQEIVYGQLRGVYDGNVSRTYATGVTRVYPAPGSEHKDCRFSILAGVTNAIHGDNRTDMGERFLKYQMVGDDYNAIDQVRRAIDNTVRQKIPEERLANVSSAFIDYLCDQCDSSKIKLPLVPKWYINRIIGLSQLSAVIRARVTRNRGELTYRPTPEVASRISKQLVKLSQCIAITLGKKVLDKSIYSLVAKVAMDSCYGWHRDVLLTLVANPDKELNRLTIAELTGTSPTTAKRVLDDLIELKAITYRTNQEDTKKGQPTRLWAISDEIKTLIDMARLGETAHIGKLIQASTRQRKKLRTTKKPRKPRNLKKYK